MSNRIVTGFAGIMLAAFALGCGENDGPTVDDAVRPLELTPASLGVLEGATSAPLVAKTADGSTATVQWESSNTAVATVSSTGAVTGVSAGVAAITARLASDASVLRSATVTVIAVPTLTLGTPTTGISGSTRGNFRYFKVNVPSGRTSLTIALSGGTGDADMYVAYNTLPTAATGNTATSCGSENSSNNETCTFTNPPAGVWYIRIQVWNNYTGASLLATVTP